MRHGLCSLRFEAHAMRQALVHLELGLPFLGSIQGCERFINGRGNLPAESVRDFSRGAAPKVQDRARDCGIQVIPSALRALSVPVSPRVGDQDFAVESRSLGGFPAFEDPVGRVRCTSSAPKNESIPSCVIQGLEHCAPVHPRLCAGGAERGSWDETFRRKLGRGG